MFRQYKELPELSETVVQCVQASIRLIIKEVQKTTAHGAYRQQNTGKKTNAHNIASPQGFLGNCLYVSKCCQGRTHFCLQNA